MEFQNCLVTVWSDLLEVTNRGGSRRVFRAISFQSLLAFWSAETAPSWCWPKGTRSLETKMVFVWPVSLLAHFLQDDPRWKTVAALATSYLGVTGIEHSAPFECFLGKNRDVSTNNTNRDVTFSQIGRPVATQSPLKSIVTICTSSGKTRAMLSAVVPANVPGKCGEVISHSISSQQNMGLSLKPDPFHDKNIERSYTLFQSSR